MLESFESFGTLAWIFVAIEVVVPIALVEIDQTVMSVCSILIFGVALQLFGVIDVLKIVQENPLHLLVLFVVYFIIGVIWSVVKWYFYVKKIAEEYSSTKIKFLEDSGATTTSELTQEFLISLRRKLRFVSEDVPPKASKNKSRIIRWMVFWPVSIILTITRDMVISVVEKIFDIAKNNLQRISDYVFKDITKV